MAARAEQHKEWAGKAEGWAGGQCARVDGAGSREGKRGGKGGGRERGGGEGTGKEKGREKSENGEGVLGGEREREREVDISPRELSMTHPHT
eukprot:1783017-Rhodomonas_salina.1